MKLFQPTSNGLTGLDENQLEYCLTISRDETNFTP